MYIYYPSCNFQRLFPDTARKVRDYLETQSDVVIAGCCHKTATIPQAGDVIVTVCMSCMRVLDEVRAEIPQINLFEFLLTRKDFPWPDLAGEAITVQDCFRARGKHSLQTAVRECMRLMRGVPVEMPRNRDEEEYDGPFRFHDPYPQNMQEAPRYFAEYLPTMVTPVPEAEWPERFMEHAKQYTTHRVVCYCNTCTTSAKQGGADAMHLASLIFGG